MDEDQVDAPLDEPLDPVSAKQLIRKIIKTGTVDVEQTHAQEQLALREMEVIDVQNVLWAGVITVSGFERGSWRYRVSTPRMEVAIAFRSATRLVVITAWRRKKGSTTTQG